MNYRSYLDLIMYKFFTLIDDVYINKNTKLIEVANKLYALLTVDEQANLVSYINVTYPN